MGLIGFDGEAGSRYVRPELLRLVKQGTKNKRQRQLGTRCLIHQVTESLATGNGTQGQLIAAR
jgi:hypothetical protein